MPNAHQTLEHVEHVSHTAHEQPSPHEHGATHRYIGVTMAVIAALIAFCAALGGSERNEMTRTMIEQTQANEEFATIGGKLRSVMLELEKQRVKVDSANLPGAAPVDAKIIVRFVTLASDYMDERAITRQWKDGFKPLIDAHFEATEGYERAQLFAEFGIVLSSLAVLLSSRPIWRISLIFVAICVGQLVWVAVKTKSVVDAKTRIVEDAEERHEEWRQSLRMEGQDRATLNQLDPDEKIRKAVREAREQRKKSALSGEKAEPASSLAERH